jgi:hypothetical protein
MLENGSTFTICSHIKTIGHYAFFTNDVYVITKLNITCDLLVPLARKLPMCSLRYGDFFPWTSASVVNESGVSLK